MTSRGRAGSAARDDGYATVWAVGWMLVLGLVAWAALLVAMAVARQHQLDGAADLAALSGAQALQRGQDGCAEASRVAAANNAGVTACDVVGEDVLLRVADRLELPFGLDLRIQIRARAGPS